MARHPIVVALSVALLVGGAGPARAADLYVDPGAAACSDAASVGTASAASTPWCTPAPALRLARPDDVVHLAGGSYRQQLRPLASGTPGHPISFVAAGDVTVSPPSDSVGVLFAHVHDLVLRGVTVHANAAQGIALDDVRSITLDSDSVTNAGGVGVWVKHGSFVTLRRCRLLGSARAGLFDSQYASGTIVRDATITGNGIDGRRYDGDGIELDGAHALVQGSTITGNGDGVGFEHGIYIGRTAAGYTITQNRIGGNAGADIKATGSSGMISYNRLDSSLYGLVFSDQSGLVTAEYNLVQGRFQHGIFLTTGTTPARARLWNNTVRQTGRSTSGGDASAVFVASAAQLVLRNNLLAYTNGDALGSALFVNSASLLGSLDSQTNWFASTDARARNLAWNGSRVTLVDWQALSAGDAASIDSLPPSFDSSGRVTSSDLGEQAGARLGLPHDLAGTPLAGGQNPDIGAYASRDTPTPQ